MAGPDIDHGLRPLASLKTVGRAEAKNGGAPGPRPPLEIA